MDVLVEIPRNKWPELRDLYKTVWPRGAVAYCALDAQITNPALGNVTSFKVYCPVGDISKGMVAIDDGACRSYPDLFIHPLNDITIIEETLKNTNVIDWNRRICVASADTAVVGCIERLQKHFGFTINYDDIARKHLLDDSRPLYDVSCPPDTYVAPPKPEHVSIIDKTWKYRSETSSRFFEMLMKNEMTYVLYSTKDDQPLTWLSVGVQGALVHLYTAEPYRRLGYAEFMTKYVADDLRRKGKPVLVYTVEGNKKPQRMFDKLGFDVIGYDRWLFINAEN